MPVRARADQVSDRDPWIQVNAATIDAANSLVETIGTFRWQLSQYTTARIAGRVGQNFDALTGPRNKLRSIVNERPPVVRPENEAVHTPVRRVRGALTAAPAPS